MDNLDFFFFRMEEVKEQIIPRQNQSYRNDISVEPHFLNSHIFFAIYIFLW